MGVPLYDGTNLHGTLVLASSGSTGPVGQGNVELNLPVGTTIATGTSRATANVQLPAKATSNIFLVQLSSGTALLTADITDDGTTPTFTSSDKVQVTTLAGLPVFVGPINTTTSTVTTVNGVVTIDAVENIVALNISNVSGATLTVQKLALISALVYGDGEAMHDDRTMYHAGSDSETGTFALDT